MYYLNQFAWIIINPSTVWCLLRQDENQDRHLRLILGTSTCWNSWWVRNYYRKKIQRNEINYKQKMIEPYAIFFQNLEIKIHVANMCSVRFGKILFQYAFKSFDIGLADPERILLMLFSVFHWEIFQKFIPYTWTNIFDWWFAWICSVMWDV